MLPVVKHKEEIVEALSEHRKLVFTAPPGSGKSTMLPQFLLDLPNLNGEVVVLQPRRLAARMLAKSVTKFSDFTFGREIGYQVRGDSNLCAQTLISYRTEGILLRQLGSKPDLRGIGAVILDEFHERSWHADLILAFLKDILRIRNDFYVVVMSATMDASRVCTFLDAPHLECSLSTYPVDISYRRFSRNTPLWDRAVKVISEHLSEHDSGNVLVFMPGAYEIRRTVEACRGLKSVEVSGLHGSMPADQQDKALMQGEVRKVIVSTNIAETSLTVDGVNTVIDTGYARVNSFDSGRALDTLNLEAISVFSAEQRAGRAGRLGPGTVYRLWSKEEHERKPLASDPEIVRIDLSEVILTVMALGKDPHEFDWYEKPPAAKMEEGLKLLKMLGAVDGNFLNATGIRMSAFPVHPRLARMLIESEKSGCIEEACRWAALVSERSPLDRNDKLVDDCSPASDLQAVVNIWDKFEKAEDRAGFSRRYRLNRNAVRNLNQLVSQYESMCRLEGAYSLDIPMALARCLLAGFRDRLAVRVDKGTFRYRLQNGSTGELSQNSAVRKADYIIPMSVTEINSAGSSRLVLSLAAEIPFDLLEEFFLEELNVEKIHLWNEKTRSVDLVERISLAGVTLSEKQLAGGIDEDKAALILCEKVMNNELKLNNWNSAVSTWMDRVRWVAEQFPEKDLITYSDEDLKLVLMEMFSGCRSFKEIKNLPVLDYIVNLLNWEEQQFVKEMTPERLELPSGKRIRLTYKPGETPRGNGFIQDFYGLEETPSVAGGRVKLILELLAPNRRIVHITDDLEGFWSGVYLDIRTQLAGRYPKHKWI